MNRLPHNADATLAPDRAALRVFARAMRPSPAVAVSFAILRSFDACKPDLDPRARPPR
ncbi:MAG: hypothetical protein H6709_08725 [Kofleriaceae bacterium]|nr:hypothetical protein [Myxococcales bacterium]MCB9572162.1 hypothetical protein [Kofleriaceae bacterium]